MEKEYRNVSKTKKAVKDAFVKLLDEKSVINKISVKELIEEANIAKSTFYLHYSDIYSVEEEFENELISTLKEIIAKTNLDLSSIEESTTEILDFISYNGEIYKKLIKSTSHVLFY